MGSKHEGLQTGDDVFGEQRGCLNSHGLIFRSIVYVALFQHLHLPSGVILARVIYDNSLASLIRTR